jgi:pilus assembly protein CpaF
MMSDIEMPLVALRLQLASGVNIVVQVSRQQDGKRKVTHITEVLGFDISSGSYILQDIFNRTYDGIGPNGELRSRLVPTGILPQCVPHLHEHGVDLPPSVYAAVERRTREGGSAHAPHR